MAHGHIHGALKILSSLLIGEFGPNALEDFVVGIQGHGRGTIYKFVQMVPGVIT